jgi:hypothetical protein
MYYEITKYSYSGGKNKNFDGTFILQKKIYLCLHPELK